MAFAVVLATMDLESPGGVANQITQLALQLKSRGIHPIVLVRNPLRRNHLHLPVLQEHDITLFVVTNRSRQLARRSAIIASYLAYPIVVYDALLRGKSIADSKLSVWGVLRRLGYWGLDVVFCLQLVKSRHVRKARVIHFRKPDCYEKIAWAQRLGFRTIYSEDTVPQPQTRHYYDGLASVMSMIDIVAACSRASAEAIQAYCDPERSIENLPHIVIVSTAGQDGSKTRTDDFVVGSFSRLAPEKDIGTLLCAAKLAIEQQSAIRFLIASDGPERSNLVSLTHELAIERNVTFLGLLSEQEMARVMANVDLVVSSSLYEGMPVALIEAMAFAKPVVATAVGGVPEIVEDGVTGILVPTGDPNALAAAICSLSSDQRLHKGMAHAARERYLTRFTPEQVVPQYVALYQRLVA